MICLSSKRLLLRGVKTVVSLRHLSSVVANAEEPVAKVIANANLRVPDAMPSGWKPAPQNIPQLPYFIWRKQQQLQVVEQTNVLLGRHTAIRNCEGDLFALREDLIQFLDDPLIEVLADEVLSAVKVSGFRAYELKKWLYIKGF